MTRRLFFALLFLVIFAGTARPKIKPEDQEYFDGQFHTLIEQMQALSKQVQALNAQLAQVQQNQTQFQEVFVRQQRSLQDMEQLVSSLRLSSEENLTALKAALAQMRSETQKSLNALAGRPTESAATGAAGAISVSSTATSATVQGYITVVEGNEVVIDQGSAKGLRVGARLGLYKATDPTTRAGVLEVTAVMDAGNSRAKIVSANPGVRPDFADIVRLE